LACGLLIGGFTELLVFNEEVLLTLCFIAFIFFAFSYSNVAVADIFQDRVAKFESDLLSTFQSRHTVIDMLGHEAVLAKQLAVGFNATETIVTTYYNDYPLLRYSRLINTLSKEIQTGLFTASS